MHFYPALAVLWAVPGAVAVPRPGSVAEAEAVIKVWSLGRAGMVAIAGVESAGIAGSIS